MWLSFITTVGCYNYIGVVRAYRTETQISIKLYCIPCIHCPEQHFSAWDIYGIWHLLFIGTLKIGIITSNFGRCGIHAVQLRQCGRGLTNIDIVSMLRDRYLQLLDISALCSVAILRLIRRDKLFISYLRIFRRNTVSLMISPQHVQFPQT